VQLPTPIQLGHPRPVRKELVTLFNAHEVCFNNPFSGYNWHQI
jgi:hypothetical protein